MKLWNEVINLARDQRPFLLASMPAVLLFKRLHAVSVARSPLPAMIGSHMTEQKAPGTGNNPGLEPALGIVEATEALFMEIASASGSEIVRRNMELMNRELKALRAYEEDLIPDRQAEFDRLSACWAARDIPGLQILIGAYMKRRQDLAPEIIGQINRPRS
ncbi:MAG: hypothetical protein NVV72_10635 [Asticcacaulis sp.]|nr:hypothetical protein [Asticcacaulis sp.]